MKNYKSKKSQKESSDVVEKCMKHICKYFNVTSTDINSVIEKFYENKKNKA